MKWTHVAATLVLALVAGLSSAQMNQMGTVAQKQFGMPAPPSETNRVIDITPETRWLNVTQDETIRIRSGGRSFDWQFATWTTSSFDLARIAPPNFGSHPALRVYVAPNPLYKGS